MVVGALLVNYLFYLGSELILIDIGNPFQSSTCLVRYAWSPVWLRLSSWFLPS
jgi:hypothetical protein